MQSQDNNVLFRDVPYFLWIFGLFFGGIGGTIVTASGAPIWMAVIFIGVGLALVVFVPILTVSLDRNSGVLILKRTGILTRSTRELRINQISDIYISTKVSSDSDGTSTTYQVNILLESGEVIPLRKYSSSGYRGKAKRAAQLREAVGLGELPERGRMNLGRRATLEDVQQAFQAQQVETTGVLAGQHITDGVNWELQTLTFGTTPVSRWVSTDVETPGYFVYLTQKQEGQGEQAGAMKLLGKTLFKQSLKMYGFDASYTPGVDQAVIVTDADKRLTDEYFIFASSDRDAYRIFNPWVTTPLVAWADRHPLNRDGQQYSQMTVLFSPWGLHISVLGELNAAELDEITSLGVELAKSATP